MKVTDLAIKKFDSDRQLEITLVTEEGKFSFIFGKLMARRMMRAIFLQIGIDPRFNSGVTEIAEKLAQDREEK